MNLDFTIVPQATLFGMMLALGMELRTGDFTRLLHHRMAVSIGLIGQLLVLPLVALLLALNVPLSVTTATGLILIAACPGGATSNMFTRYAGGDTALSISLTAVSSLLAPITIPLILLNGMRLVEGQATPIAMSAVEMSVTLLFNTVLPVLLGMLWLRFYPASAARIRGRLLKTTTIILVFLIIGLAVSTSQRQPDVIGMFTRSTVAVILLLALTAGFALLASKLLKLTRRYTLTLVLEIGTQNVNLALVIALSLLERPEYLGPTLVYLPFMLLFSAVVVFYGRRGEMK